jgi:hypothetical protein
MPMVSSAPVWRWAVMAGCPSALATGQ